MTRYATLQPHPEKGTGIHVKALPCRIFGRLERSLCHDLVAYMDEMEEEWAKKYDRKAWAICQSQVTQSVQPLRFFAVHRELVEEHQDPKNARFPARFIVNPVILKEHEPEKRSKTVIKTVLNPKTNRRELREVEETWEIPNTITCKEGCMSYPERKPKNVERVFRIKVYYWYPVKILGFEILVPRIEWVEGLKAQIFQHEIEHMDGKNIYYDTSRA